MCCHDTLRVYLAPRGAVVILVVFGTQDGIHDEELGHFLPLDKDEAERHADRMRAKGWRGVHVERVRV